jgi:hypothetical protein
MPHTVQLTGSPHVPILSFSSATNQLQQVGNIREQDLPGHLARMQRFRDLIGRRKWCEVDGASIIKAVEASRSKFQPDVMAIILVVIAITGAFFVTVLHPKPQSKL